MTPDDSFINLDDLTWMLRWLIKTCKDSCQRTLYDYCAAIINSWIDDFGWLFMLLEDTLDDQSWFTLDSEINIGVHLLIFEKKIEGKKMKNDRNALFDVKMN